VNGYGPATILGGSILDSRVTKAMEEVARCFVDMDELLDKVDSRIAQILGVEAAHVTSGAAAGLALSTAACMTGLDQSKIERLPDTSDFEKNEVVIQAGQRNTYDRCLRVSGAKLVSVGIPYLTYPWQLRAVISKKTVAIAHFTIGTARPGLLELEEVHGITEEFSVPIIVDGCNDVLPNLKNISKYFDCGADLLVLSGGKTIQGPNDSGIVCGKKDLVEACRANSYPHMNGIGRTMKVSKEQIVGILTALEIYSARDPNQQYSNWSKKLDVIQDGLRNIPNIQVRKVPDRPDTGTVPLLEIQLDEKAIGASAGEIVAALKAHDPPIVLDIDYWKNFRTQTIFVNPSCMRESDEIIVAGALRSMFTDRPVLRDLLAKKDRIMASAYP